MALRDRIPELLKLVQNKQSYLGMNHALLDIFRGNLLKYVDEALKRQLSGQSYMSAKDRIAPINVLKRVIDKQSKIYASGVRRSVEGGNDTDVQLLSWCEDAMKPTQRLQLGNEYFNLFKSTLLQPYLSRRGIPALRALPSDRFVAYSTDRDEDECPTGFILVVGQTTSPKARGGSSVVTVYQAVEETEFCYFTSEKQDVTASYSPANPLGENTYGRFPFVYINRDLSDCMPVQDTDTFAMSVLIPLLFTDVNFAHMFQAFSIMYGINVTDKGLVYSPNAFWQFETKPGTDQKPEVGQITPKADISGGLELIAAQFSLWLNTRGIKSGAVGDVNAANFASGISKILDEMDTSEDRSQQVPYFRDAEAELWDLIMRTLLPRWQATPGFQGMQGMFSADAKVVANFAEQVPLVRRGAVVKEQADERDAGFTTTRRAIKIINPTMTDQEVDQLMVDIEEEKKAKAPAQPIAPPPVTKNPNPEEDPNAA